MTGQDVMLLTLVVAAIWLAFTLGRVSSKRVRGLVSELCRPCEVGELRLPVTMPPPPGEVVGNVVNRWVKLHISESEETFTLKGSVGLDRPPLHDLRLPEHFVAGSPGLSGFPEPLAALLVEAAEECGLDTFALYDRELHFTKTYPYPTDGDVVRADVANAARLAILEDIAQHTVPGVLKSLAMSKLEALNHRRAAAWRLVQIAPDQAQHLLDASDPEVVLTVAAVVTKLPADRLLAMAHDGGVATSFRARALRLLDRATQQRHIDAIEDIARHSSGSLLAAGLETLTELGRRLPLEWLTQRFRTVGSQAQGSLLQAIAQHDAGAADWALDTLELQVYTTWEQELLDIVAAHGNARDHLSRLEVLKPATPGAQHAAAEALRGRVTGQAGGLALSAAEGGELTAANGDVEEGQLSAV